MANFEEIIRKHVGEDGNIPETAINAVVTAIKTAVGNEYVDKERYKAKLSEIDTLKEAQQNAEDNATTAEKWKEKFETLKTDFDNFKSDQAAKDAKTARENAALKYFKDKHISEDNLAIIMRGSVEEVNALELDEKGQIKDTKPLDDLVSGIYSKFIPFEGEQGAKTETPPNNTGGSTDTPSRGALLAQKYNEQKYGKAKED